MTNIQTNWLLATALKRPYPPIGQTGQIIGQSDTAKEPWFPALEHLKWFAFGTTTAVMFWLVGRAIRGDFK